MSAEERALIEYTHEAVLRGEWSYLAGMRDRFTYLYECERWAQILDEKLTVVPIPVPKPVGRETRPRIVKRAAAAAAA